MRTRTLVLVVGLSVAMLWLWHGGSVFAATTPRIALVIGNGSYTEAPLANPVNDARLMAETLRGLGFKVIERIDVDQKQMKLAIFELGDRLEKAGKDAVGLFYYAGHGVQVAGQNYLIPLDAQIEKEPHVTVEAVNAGWVLGQMEFAGNRVNFVILDACRNNPLTRSFRSRLRGLAKMRAPTGSLVAYSTGPGDVAVDGEGANSPYTLALSQAMQTPNLPAEKVFKLVRNAVREATKGEQTPWEESSMTGADFYFKIDVSVTVEAPEASTLSDTAAATQQESLFWESIKDSTDPEMFEAYLEKYPKGTFAALAKLRIEQIEAQQIAPVARQSESRPETSVQPTVGTDSEVREDRVTIGADIGGKWVTENESIFVFSGTLDLSVAPDAAVTGRYTAGLTAHGNIRGSLKQNVVTGIWIATGFSTSCDTAIEGNYSWGKFEWTFNENFTTFEGNSSRCNGPFSYLWNGARSSEALSSNDDESNR